MNDKIINKFNLIQENIKKTADNSVKIPEIICVSKTFPISKIMPLIDYGHTHFGENKVQEALIKWTKIKKEKKDLKLHLLGKLQTNKAKKAVELFDFIHSLDSKKLADNLKKREMELNKKLSYFIQINIGSELQKSGISIDEAKDFLDYCSKNLGLNIIGLMVLPPNDSNTEKYFEEINNLKHELKLQHLSMGMSNDYDIAIKHGSTFLRIGSAIFGPRDIKE